MEDGEEGGELQQQGWRRNSEEEMDRERWMCVILWTPFIYTWNKRPGLGYKRLSWWGLKWNWHFQFVPWHVCLGLFTHSSASLAILLPTPSFLLSLALSLFLPSASLQTSSHINLSLTFFLPYLHPLERPQSNKEIWSGFLYRVSQTCPGKHMCTLYYKYAFSTGGSFQERRAKHMHQRLITQSGQEIKNDK